MADGDRRNHHHHQKTMLDLQSELKKIYATIQAEAKDEGGLDLSEDEAKEIIKSIAFSTGVLP
jgi:hypothetical protein